jgi:hypothetical protein
VGEKILSPKVIHKVPEKAELKSNTKYIDIQWHFVRKKVDVGRM